MQNTNGFTILELLLSLVITSLISIILCYTLNTTIRTNLRLRQELKTLTALNTVDAHLQRVISDLDRHQLNILPRIHHQGTLNFTDLSPNPAYKNSNHKPKAENDALSILALLPAKTLKIAKLEKHLQYFKIHACLSKDSKLGKPRSFVAVSLEAFTELHGEYIKVSKSPDCYKLKLSHSKSMSLNGTADQARYARKLIPVKDHYTLYIDNNNELRYLSHVGAKNIENQPLVAGIEALHLTLQSLYEGRLPYLVAKIGISGGKSFDKYYPATLGKGKKYNFLLN